MWFLVGSVILNTWLTVLFRYFGKYKVNNFAAIVVNYLTCFLIGVIMTNGQALRIGEVPTDWYPYLIVLGVIFILTFNVIAATVQFFGVTIATLVQKMSVLLVVLFSLIYYSETLNLLRIIGLVAGFVSIFLITGAPRRALNSSAIGRMIWLPIIVFFLGGVIDSIFLHVNQAQSGCWSGGSICNMALRYCRISWPHLHPLHHAQGQAIPGERSGRRDPSWHP